MQAFVSGGVAATSGTITIGIPVSLEIARAGDAVTASGPNAIVDTLLERSSTIGSTADWQWVTNNPAGSPALFRVTLPGSNTEFLRVRRPW